jgi:hypothetical protein
MWLMSAIISDISPIVPPMPFISSLFIMPLPCIIPPMPFFISIILPCISFIWLMSMPPPCIPSFFIGISPFIGMSFFSCASTGTKLNAADKTTAVKTFFMIISSPVLLTF